MNASRVVISLPTANLKKAFQFYRDGLGLRLAVEKEGEEMPEPVEFVLTEKLTLMIVPTGGFGWVAGGNTVAKKGVSETVIGVVAGSEAGVDALVEKARAAGAEVAAEPGLKPWGYSGSFKDLDGHVFMIVK